MLKVIFCLDLRSKQKTHCICAMMATLWVAADTMLTASTTQNCSSRLL